MQTAQQELTVERIRQYPGPVQVLRKVTVQVPGKHFPSLQQAEQAQMYDAQAVEYAERHKFSQHTTLQSYLCSNQASNRTHCK